MRNPVITTSGFEAIAAGLKAREKAFVEAVGIGFEKTADEIAGNLLKDQLSGRKADDTGLNIKTGTLYDSIHSMVDIEDAKITADVYNTGAQYWEYHQEGAGHNPKRLFFDEYFEAQGLQMYEEAMEEALELMVA